MDKLMNRLERLSMAIGELNPAASVPTTPTTSGKTFQQQQPPEHSGNGQPQYPADS
jgi:hypothetical protein